LAVNRFINIAYSLKKVKVKVFLIANDNQYHLHMIPIFI